MRFLRAKILIEDKDQHEEIHRRLSRQEKIAREMEKRVKRLELEAGIFRPPHRA